MAFAHTHRETVLPGLDRLHAIFEFASTRIQQNRKFHQTVNELNALSDRDLADLAIHRSNIRSIALKAAYGDRK